MDNLSLFRLKYYFSVADTNIFSNLMFFCAYVVNGLKRSEEFLLSKQYHVFLGIAYSIQVHDVFANFEIG